MALTERYVTVAGAGTNSGVDEANAMTWAQMITDINTPRNGYRYNVKAGAYNLSASTTITGDGTAQTPNVIRGYNVTPGDLDALARTGGDGPLDTTNYPVITYDATFRFNLTGANYTVVQNLRFAGDAAAALVDLAIGSVARLVKALNASTNSAAAAMALGGNACVVEDCDLDCGGASGALGSLRVNGGDCVVVGCRFMDSPGAAIVCSSASLVVAGCVFGADVDGVCVDFTSGTASNKPPTILGCTSFGAGASFYRGAAQGYSKVAVLIGNHVTDGGGYLAESLYSGTNMLQVHMSRNRTRDLASGVSLGYGDWAQATTVGHVTTDAGNETSDYVDAAGGDFALRRGAAGRSQGTMGRDIGAVPPPASAARVIGG